jgi:hypothetical protein
MVSRFGCASWQNGCMAGREFLKKIRRPRVFVVMVKRAWTQAIDWPQYVMVTAGSCSLETERHLRGGRTTSFRHLDLHLGDRIESISIYSL